jgi:hypothetical protein
VPQHEFEIPVSDQADQYISHLHRVYLAMFLPVSMTMSVFMSMLKSMFMFLFVHVHTVPHKHGHQIWA